MTEKVEALADLLSIHVSPGTIATWISQCSTRLTEVESQIKAALTREKVIHQDETGVYVNGTCYWMHVCSTKLLTHYGVHPQRYTQALDAIGISPKFHGVSVHDGWPMYHRYFHEHALCNVHHLRELTFVEEQLKQPWAGKMIGLLLEMKSAVAQAQAAGENCLDPLTLSHFNWRYTDLLDEGDAANPALPVPKQPKRGPPKHTPAQNLLRRLRTYREEVLLFAKRFDVPFDNNQAERDLRMAKVQQKISGCFRSEKGATAFARIRGYLSTIRKQGQSVLSALEQTLSGHPLLPAFS